MILDYFNFSRDSSIKIQYAISVVGIKNEFLFADADATNNSIVPIKEVCWHSVNIKFGPIM